MRENAYCGWHTMLPPALLAKHMFKSKEVGSAPTSPWIEQMAESCQPSRLMPKQDEENTLALLDMLVVSAVAMAGMAIVRARMEAIRAMQERIRGQNKYL